MSRQPTRPDPTDSTGQPAPAVEVEVDLDVKKLPKKINNLKESAQ
ncbi:hypothetical protein [Stenotrophomonas rhizophila]|nr:hypothetical protein [Stenotrophomonas rhizophila]